MPRATVVSEAGVQFAVWLLLTLLLIIFGFLLYFLGMTGFIGWGIYGYRLGHLRFDSRCGAVACGGKYSHRC